MKRTPRGSRWGTTWSCWLACCLLAERVLAAPDFNRDVRPILSQYCFKCHGPDESKREAGVRLDLRETAVGPSDSGTPIIVPGHPEQSALMRRVESTDPDVRMPPPASHLQLTAAQKEILRAWIEAGAEYQPHWAFVPPQSAPRPHPQVATWSRNFIDDYILAALEQRGWQPSPEADRYTLIRRLSLDLIGIPPTWEEADTFAHDPDPLAYEKLVDRLLASPRYGERWARRWLDLARYADTNGYEKDRPRSMWPYRDWVIRALNADLPFDQFTIEQLAGDMLPQATLEQQIATGFHRNTMINEEGGIDPLEFRFYAMTDRVATTGTVWLGLTLGCAQCHTHKYDPIQLTEYYGLMAFLNNADELELEVPQPAIEQQRLALLTTLAQREATLPEQFPVADAWQWQPMTLTSARARGGSTLSILPMGVVMASGKNPAKDTYVVTATVPAGTYEALRVEALTDPNLGQRGPGRTPHGNFVLTEIKATWLTGETTQPLRFAQAQADYAQEGFPAEHVFDGNARTGWAIHGEGVWNVDRTLTLWFREPVVLTHDSTLEVELEQEYGSQHTLGKFRLSLGQSREDAGPVAWRRIQHYQEKYHRWLATQAAYAVEWIPLVPRRWHTNLPRLQLLPDGSLLASGDQTKRDVYELEFGPELSGATALRLEVLPDERLPKHGPGRVYYEGPLGDFFLSELQCTAGEALLPWRAAVHSFASGGNTAQAAIDGNPLTGWSINGGQGQPHVAVFQFASAVPAADAYTVRMIFERYYAAGLGRFRWSYTRSPRQPEAPALPPDVEQLLLVPAEHWSPEHQQLMHRTFCAQAPELAGARRELEQLRRQLPSHPTTLVFRERPRDYPRPTHWHRRGEFLQPQDPRQSACARHLASGSGE
ncbi:MAG: hypothetical protein KatS3mg114_0350 [Planctomycetaceae bacterium]|nr:MAG: hypothetical protein KatS3mg114_0350 [Planctomycetaceae bacterium]